MLLVVRRFVFLRFKYLDFRFNSVFLKSLKNNPAVWKITSVGLITSF